MKKSLLALSLALAVSSSLFLASCGKDKAPEQPAQQEQAAAPADAAKTEATTTDAAKAEAPKEEAKAEPAMADLGYPMSAGDLAAKLSEAAKSTDLNAQANDILAYYPDFLMQAANLPKDSDGYKAVMAFADKAKEYYAGGDKTLYSIYLQFAMDMATEAEMTTDVNGPKNGFPEPLKDATPETYKAYQAKVLETLEANMKGRMKVYAEKDYLHKYVLLADDKKETYEKATADFNALLDSYMGAVKALTANDMYCANAGAEAGKCLTDFLKLVGYYPTSLELTAKADAKPEELKTMLEQTLVPDFINNTALRAADFYNTFMMKK